VPKELKQILLIITGSIAAYKAIDLIRLLKKNDYNVSCVLTKAAQEFITPLLCSSISGNKTYTDLFLADDEIEMGHINLSRQADLIVVAPASADFMAKIANGLADDLASNVILASNKKVFIAPAMNEKMWQNKQTQQNLAKLIENNFKLIAPETDILACGEYGIGKMANIENIYQETAQYFAHKDLLKGKKILLTGGGTIEPIDPVRFIGNHSSGKQAIEIAKILDEMGAEVIFVAANIKEQINLKSNKILHCKTADEMFDLVKNNLDKLDVFVSCAAVSDYKIKNFSKEKIKKSSNKNLTLELEENPDILKYVGNAKNRPQLVIGFAAESNNLEKYGKEKLKNKNCDYIIANNINDGAIFSNNKTEALIIDNLKTQNLGVISKAKLALEIAGIISNF